jgi:hypothetical protein
MAKVSSKQWKQRHGLKRKESVMSDKVFRSISLWVIVCLSIIGLSATHALAARPQKDKGPTTVYLSVWVVDVDEVKTAEQSYDANVYFEFRWNDPRLANKNNEVISKKLAEIWNPRIQIVNQQKIFSTLPDIVEIRSNGDVVCRQRVWGSFSQPLQLRDFPFDQHNFTIQLVAVGHGPEEISLVQDPDVASGISENLSVADFDVLHWKAEAGEFKMTPNDVPTAGFSFSFESKRRTGYFIIKVIFPLILIVAMSWVVFWIDPKESGTQISVAITTMLTLIAYRFAIDTSLPKVSYLTRLDYFVLASTILVYASLLEVIVTSSYASANKIDLARSIDRWARGIFPLVFMLMAFETLYLSLFGMK